MGKTAWDLTVLFISAERGLHNVLQTPDLLEKRDEDPTNKQN